MQPTGVAAADYDSVSAGSALQGPATELPSSSCRERGAMSSSHLKTTLFEGDDEDLFVLGAHQGKRVAHAFHRMAHQDEVAEGVI